MQARAPFAAGAALHSWPPRGSPRSAFATRVRRRHLNRHLEGLNVRLDFSIVSNSSRSFFVTDEGGHQQPSEAIKGNHEVRLEFVTTSEFLEMHPLSEPLAAATRASITLPPSERPLFIGKHLLAQAQNAETLPTATSASGTATISKAARQEELAALAKILTTALNAVSGLPGSSLQRLADHLIAEYGGASDTATAHAIAIARPNVLNDAGDDTNLDDIDDDNEAVLPTVAIGAPSELVVSRTPPGSPSLAVEQGHMAAPEDKKVAEPAAVPETTDSAHTEVVEPAAGAATEAESAQAVASTEARNPIFEISDSMVNASVQAFTPRGPSSSGPSRSPDALSVRKMHRAILKADNSPRQPVTFRTSTDDYTLLPPKLHRALTELDAILIQVLLRGAIRLLRVEWLMKQLDHFRMPRRQVLEELEVSGVLPSPLLSGEEAAALVRRGNRSIGALTYGWLSPGDPDPDGSRIRVLRRALTSLAIEALFWDFGSLYQNPRSPEQEDTFVIALKGGAMNQLYASILATTVLQIEEIPPRPAEFDGVVCLFKLSANVDEDVVRAALIGFGTIESCDLSRTPAPIVRFASHESAVKAKEAGAWPGLCEGLDTLYNETPYFSRGW